MTPTKINVNKLYFGDNLDILREHDLRSVRSGIVAAVGFNPRSGEPNECAPTERAGTERPRFPDLTLGRPTFKRAAEEDMGAEQEKLL